MNRKDMEAQARLCSENIESKVVIELKQVCKNYHLGDTSITALHEVSLKIAQNEFVALWGPSGSGKTTMCNIIGLLDHPCSGDLLLSNKHIGDQSDGKLSELRNKEIGFIFQDFNLIQVLSALENVMLPMQIRGVNRKQSKVLAQEQLTKVDLGAYFSHRPKKLSGGQQQRVAIARALVTNPSLIIADEPTANLDTETAHKIIDLMLEINARDGTTFVFSTHDQRLLERVDRQILLRDGVICEDKRL